MPSEFIITAARLIDGTGASPVPDPWIHVRDGVIIAIGDGDHALPGNLPLLDLRPLVLVPGLVDAHMHFFGVPSHQLDKLATEGEAYRALRAAGEARKMLEAGVTAARCLGSSVGPPLRQAIDEGHVPGPRLMVAGQFVCSTGGTWDNLTLPLSLMAKADMIADGPDAVRAIVRRRVRQGATVIKVGLSKGLVTDGYHAWGDDPYHQTTAYSLAEVRAAVEEAHANDLKVSAHCIGEQAVRLALDAEVDVIEHGYPVTPETRQRLVETGTIVVSTMSQLFFHLQAAEAYHYADWEKRVYQAHADAMHAGFAEGLAQGVRYALGSDLIGYPTHPQDHSPKEFELAVQHGMSPMQALIAGTKTSAEALGLQDMLGSIAVGKCADLVGVAEDPLKDISVLQRVSFVMKSGEVVRDIRPGGATGEAAAALPRPKRGTFMGAHTGYPRKRGRTARARLLPGNAGSDEE
jgi:imidazolonepropionase-like amidohydrolase